MQGQYTRSWAGSEESRPGSVRPRFFLDPVQDELASAREGRPIFKQIQRVEIYMPGNQWNIPVHNVTDEHRHRWSEQYEKFRAGLDQTISGTPLGEWPILNRAQVMELNALQIMSIEECAALSDQACQRAMGLVRLREKAQAYLDDAVAGALTEKLSAENEAQRSEIASQGRQIEELSTLVNRLHGEVMAMRNAPNPLATAIPAASDPMQQMLMQQAGSSPRDDPVSSLAAFGAENEAQQRRGPGRPRKVSEEVA